MNGVREGNGQLRETDSVEGEGGREGGRDGGREGGRD